MTIGQNYPSGKDRTIIRAGNWGWIALAIVVAAIVAGFATYPMADWRNTAVQTGISVAPSTTDGANAAPDRFVPSITQGQSLDMQEQSIQVGGPIDAGSGSAPASNPRGETAPGMQSGPGAGNVSPTK